MSVLDCLFNAVTQILRKNVDKKALFDNLEVAVICVFLGKSSLQVIMLALDEMIDGGMIIECDPQQVLNLDPVSSYLNWHRF